MLKVRTKSRGNLFIDINSVAENYAFFFLKKKEVLFLLFASSPFKKQEAIDTTYVHSTCK